MYSFLKKPFFYYLVNMIEVVNVYMFSRNYLEYVGESISDWLQEEEAKYSAHMLTRELDKMRQEEDAAAKAAEQAAKKGKKSPRKSPSECLPLTPLMRLFEFLRIIIMLISPIHCHFIPIVLMLISPLYTLSLHLHNCQPYLPFIHSVCVDPHNNHAYILFTNL